jgi:anti-sigma regulatory factor (Ser/Thr protein kinase)
MGDIGHNPACIIPAWRDFVAGRSGPLRGVGEPIWPSRTPDELVECQCHEALLNHAFADTDGFHLLCPYDAAHLDRDVIEEAERAHPWVGAAESPHYRGHAEAPPQFSAPLPPAPGEPPAHPIDHESLPGIRALVATYSRACGVPEPRANDLVLATHEVAANSIVHAGGAGVLRIWDDAESVICEISDRGRIDKPLAGRARPKLDDQGGWGLWLANQLCDLVQLRTLADGSVVRLHVRVG